MWVVKKDKLRSGKRVELGKNKPKRCPYEEVKSVD